MLHTNVAAKCRDPRDTDVMWTLDCGHFHPHVTVMIIIAHLAVACSAGAALVNECPDSLGSTHLRVETHYDEEDPANYVTKEEYLRMQKLGSTRGG